MRENIPNWCYKVLSISLAIVFIIIADLIGNSIPQTNKEQTQYRCSIGELSTELCGEE